MFSNTRIRWVILKTCIEERLVYRSDFAFATLIRFLPIVTQVFLWGAIFGIHSDSPKDDLNGYSYSQMVSYYLLVMVGRAFSSMPGLASGISRDITDGSIKKYLTQPIDMLGYLFWHRVAHKLVYYTIATGPFILVFYLCRDYFDGRPDAFTITAWVVSLLFSFLVGFLIESLIGLISFWFLEVSSLIFIYMMMNFFLSGHMIPLDFLGEFSYWIQLLPFKYLAYFPATVLLNGEDGLPRYNHSELIYELGIELTWILALLTINRIAFSKGVRRYSAFGG